MPAWKKLQLSSYIKIGLLFFRLIDPQTQVTRLRVRWPQFLQFCLVSKIWVVSLLSLLTGIPLSLQFPLSTVVQCSSHQDNKRLFGFVLQSASGRSDSRAMCYIFESNNDGEKVVCLFICLAGGVTHPSFCLIVCLLHAFQICDSIGLAKQIALHSEMVRL